MRRPKYRNIRTEFRGVSYASKAEARRAEELYLLQRSGLVLEVIRQPRFMLAESIPYAADFLVVSGQGAWVEDIKGMETQRWRDILRLWQQHGNLVLAYKLRKVWHFCVPRSPAAVQPANWICSITSRPEATWPGFTQNSSPDSKPR